MEACGRVEPLTPFCHESQTPSSTLKTEDSNFMMIAWALRATMEESTNQLSPV